MFGLFCKGLHCAGCGKGMPLSVVLLLVGIFAVQNQAFDDAVGGAILLLAYAVMAAAVMWILTMAIVVWLIRKGPRVVYVRATRTLYSEAKFLETGDKEFLALSDNKRLMLEARKDATADIYTTEVIPEYRRR